MNMTLKEWNDVIAYAKNRCQVIKDEGYNVKPTSYTMHDGRKGIMLLLLDDFDEVYRTYQTGICGYGDMIQSIDNLMLRIKLDHPVR